MKTEKQKQGKKNRQAGARFELKVRADLEKQGWIVDKWSNNVEFEYELSTGKILNFDSLMKNGEKEISKNLKVKDKTRLIKVKNKFLGPNKPMMLGAGFPDFEAKRFLGVIHHDFKEVGIKAGPVYEVIGIEAKSNGILDKQEKEKCKWLLENKIFSKILIAQKGEKRGTIKYKEVYK